MAKTIAKGRLFRVTSEFPDEHMAAMKKDPELATQAMQVGANYWHTGMLPRHFDKDAHGRYGYASRSKGYSKKREKGQKPDLVLSGSMRRDLRARASFTISTNSVDLKMTARVLNLCPAMPQNSSDLYVKRSKGGGYPNMKREIRVVLPDELAAISAVVRDDLASRFEGLGQEYTNV